MKIAFNPSTVAALTAPPNNKDITFDLRGRNIFARGVKFQGTDTNTWRDIKVNNVSIGSYTLDLRNGSNTTLTNTNGVVTINSTWRPVVDNLTSDSTTSSLSANQGRVLVELINGKSDSDHNHDDKYLPLAGGIMNSGARISHDNGDLYIGRADNNGWVFTQNIASHEGVGRWNIRTSGAAQFGIIHIASKTDSTFNSNVIECSSAIHLNYFSDKNVTLCNGGGNVTIGDSTDSSGYKLQVYGDQYTTGWSRASGFTKNGSSSSYVLLGDGGHQTISSLSVNYANSAGSATSATKVIVNQHTSNDINYPLVWSNQSNTNSVTENQLFKSWQDLYYNPKNKILAVGGYFMSPWARFTDQNGALVIGDNISARISAIGDQIIFNTGSALRFGETAWDWNQWAGLKYKHSAKTIYLGIADDSVFNANSAQSNGTLKFPGISNIDLDNGAQIRREGSSQAWVNGRNGALLRETSVAGYHALWSLKTTNGSWDFGEYNAGSGWNNVPVLSYVTDSNYNSGNNTATYQIRFPLDSGTVALTKNIPSSLPANGGNADTLGGTSLGGLFTAFGNNAHNITATIGGVTKSFLVNYAADADKVDGVHITWAGALTSTNHLVAWEADGSALRNINPANVSVGNSDKVDGIHATSGNNTPWGTIPAITTSGQMDIGKQLEFHYDNTTGSDYSTVLRCTGNYSNIIDMPSRSGTLALTSDIKDTNTWRPITDDYELGESGTSLSSLGSLTLYNDLLGSIPNPTNYYWANIKVSASSNSGTSPTFNTAYATNWFRARGNSGFYFQDHAGGFYMEDNTWIKTWGSKALYVNNTIRSTNLQAMYGSTSVSAAKLESATTLIYGTDTSSNSINTYLRGTNVTLQVKKGASPNYNALQLTDTYIYCHNYCDMKQGAAVSGGNLTVSTKAYIAQRGLLIEANDQIWYQQPVCIACGYVYDGPIQGHGDRTQQIACNQKASIKLLDGNGEYIIIFTNIIANKFDHEQMSLQLTGCPHGIDSRGVTDARGSVTSYGTSLAIKVYTSDDNSWNPTSFYFALWTWE